MHECNTKQIFVGDDRSLSVVGSGTVLVENGHFSDVLCVPKILSTGTVDDITKLYKFNNFESSPFPSVFVAA